MSALRTEDPPLAGLRQRKKARTRALIQEHALRLFHEQGYETTSVEQIATAAEVAFHRLPLLPHQTGSGDLRRPGRQDDRGIPRPAP
jgi:hypothetical protein